MVEEITGMMVLQSLEKLPKREFFLPGGPALDCGATAPWCTTSLLKPKSDRSETGETTI